jgi:hypothetical protein
LFYFIHFGLRKRQERIRCGDGKKKAGIQERPASPIGEGKVFLGIFEDTGFLSPTHRDFTFYLVGLLMGFYMTGLVISR